MLPAQFSPQDADSARVALVLIVAAVMLFGRILGLIMLRVVLAIIVVAVAVGAVTLFQGVHL